MNLVIEEETSYIHLVFSPRNKNNQVKVFLQESTDSEPLA